MVSILTPVRRDNSPIGIPCDLVAREALIWNIAEAPCFCSHYRMHARNMLIKDEDFETRMRRGQELMAAGSMVGASQHPHTASCRLCCSPLASAEHGSATSRGSRPISLIHRSDASICGMRLLVGFTGQKPAPAPTVRFARGPLPSRIVKASLILATILVVAALGLNFVAPLFSRRDRSANMKKLVARPRFCRHRPCGPCSDGGR